MTHAGFLGLQAASFQAGGDFQRLLEQAASDLRATAPDTTRVAASAGGSHRRFGHRLEDLAKQVSCAQIFAYLLFHAGPVSHQEVLEADSLPKCADTQTQIPFDDIAQEAARAIRAYRAEQCELWEHARRLQERAGTAEASLGSITEALLRDRRVQFDRVQRGSIPWAYLRRCAQQPGPPDCPSLQDLTAAYDRAIRGGARGWLPAFFRPNPTPVQIHQALGNLSDRGVVGQHAAFARRAVRRWGNWAGAVADRVEMTAPVWDSLESRAMMYGNGDWPGHGGGAGGVCWAEDAKKSEVLGLLTECRDVLSFIDVDGRVKL